MSKDAISFTKVDEDVVFDSIPLAELTSVERLKDFKDTDVQSLNSIGVSCAKSSTNDKQPG